MIGTEFTFNLHNTKLYGKYFRPETIKAIVILVHGMGEHLARYENYVIPFLNQNSIAVLAYDQFGHGKTEGKRGHNPSFDALLDCVGKMFKKAKNIFGDKPMFLYGHSMGGNVVINYVLRRKNSVKGVIATSPFLRLAFSPPSWKLSVGKILQKYLPSITLGNELDPSSISRDKKEVEAYINDPLIHDRVSPNYSITIMKTGEWAIQNAQKLKVPMLLMHGTGDKIISYEATKEFANNSNKNVELYLFKDAYHELHNEINKEEVLEKIKIWIEKLL